MVELEGLLSGDRDRDKEDSLCEKFVFVFLSGLVRFKWKSLVSLNLRERCGLNI